ncbi:MAG: hypothetical protein WD407_08695 [Rhodospirillales bacterium]
MTELSQDRNTPYREGDLFEFPVAASVLCYAGALAVLDAAGNVKPGVAATGLIGVGRFEERVDNSSGDAAALSARIKRGVFRWANSEGGDEITKAEIGDACYVVDDQTVAKTDGGSARSKAGLVVDVDALGVWVGMGVETLNSPASALLAANNLSDLATKATARNNLGVAEKMSAPAVVVGEQESTAINVTIQLKDAAGNDLAVRGSVYAYLSDDDAGDSITGTAPDGGAAIGTDGVLIPAVADKAFRLVSESDGDIDVTFTESSTGTWYLILVMPDGTLVASDAITFA